MKILTLCKIVFSSSLSFLIVLLMTLQELPLQARHHESISKECQQFRLKKLDTEKAIIKDATAKIKSSLKKSGHPSSIRCTYSLSGSNTISTTTKIYYDEYHKRPDFFKECYLHDAIPADKVVEILYNKHDKSMSLSFKDPRHKHEQISRKEVAAPASLLAA